jgi:hypothetical protein
MHAPRTMRTPSSMRTRTTPDAARSRPMLVRFGGGVWTPSSIRRRATPHTGFPTVIMFMVARWTIGATRAKRPRAAIHTLTHCSALPSSCICHTLEVHEWAGGRTPAGVVIGLLAPAHTDFVHAARGRMSENKQEKKLYPIISDIGLYIACDLHHNSIILKLANVIRDVKRHRILSNVRLCSPRWRLLRTQHDVGVLELPSPQVLRCLCPAPRQLGWPTP